MEKLETEAKEKHDKEWEGRVNTFYYLVYGPPFVPSENQLRLTGLACK